jgi:hypothetical protein
MKIKILDISNSIITMYDGQYLNSIFLNITNNDIDEKK